MTPEEESALLAQALGTAPAPVSKGLPDEEKLLQIAMGTTPKDVPANNWYIPDTYLGRLGAGAGAGVANVGLGAKQRLNDMLMNQQGQLGVDWLYKKLGYDPAATANDLQAQVAEKRRLDKPLIDSPGGTLGQFLGEAGVGAPTFLLPATLPLAIMSSMGMSALQPTTKDESVVKNMAMGGVGGAAGYGLGKAIGNVISPAVTAKGAAQDLLDKGVPVRLDQTTDSRLVKNIGAAMDNMPFTSGVRQSQKQAQNEALNRAASRTMGADFAKITDDAMGQARAPISAAFTDLASRNTLTDTPTLVKGLIDVQNNIAKLPANIKGAVQAHVDDIIQKIDPTTGTMPGDVYRMLDTQLGKAMKGGGDMAGALGPVRDSLRSAMDNSISKADQEAWQTARRQYGNMMAIANSRDKFGNILPTTLYNKTAKGNSSVKFGGGSDLAELARAAREIVPNSVGDSGTAQRLMMQNLLQYGSLGGAGAGYGAATGQDPYASAAKFAGVGLLGNMGARAMGSNVGNGYMANNLLPEAMKKLLMQSGGLLGGAALSP